MVLITLQIVESWKIHLYLTVNASKNDIHSSEHTWKSWKASGTSAEVLQARFNDSKSSYVLLMIEMVHLIHMVRDKKKLRLRTSGSYMYFFFLCSDLTSGTVTARVFFFFTNRKRSSVRVFAGHGVCWDSALKRHAAQTLTDDVWTLLKQLVAGTDVQLRRLFSKEILKFNYWADACQTWSRRTATSICKTISRFRIYEHGRCRCPQYMYPVFFRVNVNVSLDLVTRDVGGKLSSRRRLPSYIRKRCEKSPIVRDQPVTVHSESAALTTQDPPPPPPPHIHIRFPMKFVNPKFRQKKIKGKRQTANLFYTQRWTYFSWACAVPPAESKATKKSCRDQDSNLGYCGHNAGS